MPLLDLSLVTQALVTLLREQIDGSSAWTSPDPPDVSPDPPDELEGDSALGLYLYHISEDPGNKNMLPLGGDRPPIRFTPMPLILHFQLSAHSDLAAPTGTHREQLLMGLAMKTLHDYPVITDSTEVAGTGLLESVGLDGDDNCLRISLLPTDPNEAINYWTAGSSPLRLAAYYQVEVVMLEPDEPTSRAGRVLTYYPFVFPSQLPRIISSTNTLTFAIPGEVDQQEVTLRPAQVPIGGEVSFEGTGLEGDRLLLLLKSARLDEPVAVDSSAWNVSVAAGRVTATIQDQAGPHTIIPGTYGAILRVTRQRQLPGGVSRDFDHFTNESPFIIAPRLDPLPPPDAAGVFTVTGDAFAHPDPPPVDVQVYVGDTRLTEGTAGSLNPGEFDVIDASTLEVRLPAGLTAGDTVPFRLLVNGAESPPQWSVIP